MLSRFKFLVVSFILSLSIFGLMKGTLAVPPPPNFVDSWSLGYYGSSFSEGRFHVSSYDVSGYYTVYSTNTNYTSCLIHVSFRNEAGTELGYYNISKGGTSTIISPGQYPPNDDTRCSFSFNAQPAYVNGGASFVRVSGCAVTTSDDCQHQESWVTFTDLEVNIPPTNTPVPTLRSTRTPVPSITPTEEPITDNSDITLVPTNPELTDNNVVTPTVINNSDNIDCCGIAGANIIVPVAIGVGVFGILIVVSILIIAKIRKHKVVATPANTDVIKEPTEEVAK